MSVLAAALVGREQIRHSYSAPLTFPFRFKRRLSYVTTGILYIDDAITGSIL
jgi:hypothetical protein